MEIASDARRALKWSLAAQFVARAGSFSLGILLARLLLPSDFGTYTVALGVFTILLTIDDLGLFSGLIRWPGDFDAAAPVARSIACTSSICVYAMIFFLAPTVAAATNTPAATAAIRVLCLGIVLDAIFQIVPAAALHRRFRQDLWVVVELSRLATTAAVTLSVVAAGGGVSALVAGALAGQTVGIIANVLLARVPFRFRYDRTIAIDLLTAAAPYALAALVGAILLNVDYLVIGHVLGTNAVGFYLIAFNVSSWPISLVGTAVRAVAIPGFAKLHQSGGDAGRALRRGLTLLLAGGAPFVALLVAAPSIVVEGLYGAKWVTGGAALRFLALMSIVRLLNGLVEDALFALNRSSWILVKNVGWLILLLVALPIGANLDGIRGVGIAQAVVACGAVLPFSLWLTARAGLWDSRLVTDAAAIVPAAVLAGLAGWQMVGRFELPVLAETTLVATVVLVGYLALITPSRHRILSMDAPLGVVSGSSAE